MSEETRRLNDIITAQAKELEAWHGKPSQTGRRVFVLHFTELA